MQVLLMTSYLRAAVGLTNIFDNSSAAPIMEGVSPITFTGLTPSTEYLVNITLVFVGEFYGPVGFYGGAITPPDSESHEKSHDQSHDSTWCILVCSDVAISVFMLLCVLWICCCCKQARE